MKLYHGTSTRYLEKIMQGGLRPRGRKKGNWGHTVEGSSDCIYLTVAYAHHFALESLKDKRERCVIVEIDTNLLDTHWLVPDEDALAFHNKKDSNKSLIELSEEYKHRLLEFAGTKAWEASINLMGNCAHFGRIPEEAITRIVSFSREGVWLFSDPSISPLNYQIMGDYYRNLISHTFGDKVEEYNGFGQDPTKAVFKDLKLWKGTPGER
jgi:hypothetical protein